MYYDAAKEIEAAIRPEHAGLTPAGRTKLSLFMVLACSWGAGDALAGNLLAKADQAKIADTLLAMGLATKRCFSMLSWSVDNLDAIADFLLTAEMAERVKLGALSGRGFSRSTSS